MPSKSPKSPRFLAVDFFCGAGGTTRGLLKAGGLVIAGIDKDEGCRETFVGNNTNRFGSKREWKAPAFLPYDIFPRSKGHPGGQRRRIREELDALIGDAKARLPGVPMLFAICAPCQPFTRLSYGEAMSRERSEARARDRSLLDAALHFVRRHEPEMVLSENVGGVRRDIHRAVWDDFRRGLERAGYRTGTEVVCASKFGVPQHRRRAILLGVREDSLGDAPLTLAGDLVVPTSDPRAKVVSVREAIGRFPRLKAGEHHPSVPNHIARGLDEINIRRLRSLMPGESNAGLADTPFGDLSLPCHRRTTERLGVVCFGDVYTRMHPDRPSPTITTRCNSISNGRFGHYDRRQNRGISPREAAALQSFDDDYVFHPADRLEAASRMIGNAVPPLLAKFFAERLVESLRA